MLKREGGGGQGGVTNQLSNLRLKLKREKQECIRNPKSLSK